MSQYLLHFSRKHEHVVQFVRYICVGGIMLVLNLMLVWFFVRYFGMHYLVASGFAFIIESVAAFFANRQWTFKTDTHFRTGYIRFLTIAFYSFLVVLIITYGLVHFFAFHYVWGRTVSTLITGFIGYFLDLKITFRV